MNCHCDLTIFSAFCASICRATGIFDVVTDYGRMVMEMAAGGRLRKESQRGHVYERAFTFALRFYRLSMSSLLFFLVSSFFLMRGCFGNCFLATMPFTALDNGAVLLHVTCVIEDDPLLSCSRQGIYANFGQIARAAGHTVTVTPSGFLGVGQSILGPVLECHPDPISYTMWTRSAPCSVVCPAK